MVPPTTARAETKVLLCTGDYGMWAQNRAEMIRNGVEKAAPGTMVFETEQSFNFVKKLEAPDYAARFDVIVVADVGLGQMTTAAQQALVNFVAKGGGLVFGVFAKSTVPYEGAREVDPQPLAAILPTEYPKFDAVENARNGSVAVHDTEGIFKGLDFSGTPWPERKNQGSPLALERPSGKGRVLALYSGFGASYEKKGYAKYEKRPGGWDEWPHIGEFWARILKHVAATSPVLAKSRAELEKGVTPVDVKAVAQVDATRQVDDVRAANFSMVALQQLYNEDGGRGEDDFLALNPQDWFDRRSQEVVANTRGKKQDKPALFREYNIKGIIMANASYGSYSKWDDEKWEEEINDAADAAKKYPDFLTFLQPGNEPHCNEGYYTFYNRYTEAVLKEAPDLKVIGPGAAWNLRGVNQKQMAEFIDKCGANTDVLNWHIYARPPSSVRDTVKYWVEQADGKLRSKGPVKVMFTEADAWNTRDSQFNYLMDRAYTFLQTPEIIGCFQYCVRPRHEGGTYRFGVLFPGTGMDEFMANYNAYWIFRNLRGKLVETKPAITPAAAAGNFRVLSSVSKDNATVTVVAYYDTGYLASSQRGEHAAVELNVKLPPGTFTLERSDADWLNRKAEEIPGEASGTVSVSATLAPCHAVAWTWRKR